MTKNSYRGTSSSLKFNAVVEWWDEYIACVSIFFMFHFLCIWCGTLERFFSVSGSSGLVLSTAYEASGYHDCCCLLVSVSNVIHTSFDNRSILSGGIFLYENTTPSLLYITLSPVLGQRPQRTSSNESMWPTTWPYSRGTSPASSLKISPDSATRQILPALLKSRPCYVYLTHLTTPYNTRDCIHALSITSPPKLFTCKFVFSSCISEAQ